MRHGVQEGIVLDAIAALGGVSADAVRRAHQALGDIGRLAALVKTDPAGLAAVGVRLFHPIKPMLAQGAADVAAACTALGGRLALEWKLDGARVQIHKQGAEVRIFSRRLQDITRSLPDVVDLVTREAAADTAIYEGEVTAVADGQLLPFQELMRRFRRVRDVADAARAVPVQLYLFDLLYLGAQPLLDHAAGERWEALQAARGGLTARAARAARDDLRGAGFLRGRARRRSRGRDGEGARQPVHPGRARRGVAEDQAQHHARPRHRRGRLGLRPPARLAEQLPPGGARPGERRARAGRQDVQRARPTPSSAP